MNEVKVIWKGKKPTSEDEYQKIVGSHYYAACKLGKIVISLLIRGENIHNTTVRDGQKEPDKPHVTVSWQTEELFSAQKFAVAHAYMPKDPDYWVDSVITGPVKPISAKDSFGRLIWPAQDRQDFRMLKRSDLEVWADESQGKKGY